MKIGVSTISYALQLGMYDSTDLLRLLKGKYIVMFGDSTLEENMYDLILLLTSRNLDAMASYLTTGVRCVSANKRWCHACCHT